jgi:hypothetical protein
VNQTKIFFQIVLFVAAAVFFQGCAKEETKPAAAPPENDSLAVSAAPTNNVAPVGNKVTSTAGISGKIILQGTSPPERDLPLSVDCGKLHATLPKTRLYVVGQDGALADVFVYIKEGLSGKTFPAATESVVLDQVGCEYTPYVVGLQTGQKLLVRNSDPTMHNVHALPKISGNKESNKAQMAKSPELEYSFNAPEIFLTFKCDVHPWMYAYVGVVDHPFFAVSGKDGMFQLKNVPDGKYVVEAVHRKAGKQTKEISVTDGKSEPINFAFEIPASL